MRRQHLSRHLPPLCLLIGAGDAQPLADLPFQNDVDDTTTPSRLLTQRALSTTLTSTSESSLSLPSSHSLPGIPLAPSSLSTTISSSSSPSLSFDPTAPADPNSTSETILMHHTISSVPVIAGSLAAFIAIMAGILVMCVAQRRKRDGSGHGMDHHHLDRGRRAARSPTQSYTEPPPRRHKRPSSRSTTTANNASSEASSTGKSEGRSSFEHTDMPTALPHSLPSPPPPLPPQVVVSDDGRSDSSRPSSPASHHHHYHPHRHPHHQSPPARSFSHPHPHIHPPHEKPSHSQHRSSDWLQGSVSSISSGSTDVARQNPTSGKSTQRAPSTITSASGTTYAPSLSSTAATDVSTPSSFPPSSFHPPLPSLAASLGTRSSSPPLLLSSSTSSPPPPPPPSPPPLPSHSHLASSSTLFPSTPATRSTTPTPNPLASLTPPTQRQTTRTPSPLSPELRRQNLITLLEQQRDALLARGSSETDSDEGTLTAVDLLEEQIATLRRQNVEYLLMVKRERERTQAQAQAQASTVTATATPATALAGPVQGGITVNGPVTETLVASTSTVSTGRPSPPDAPPPAYRDAVP